MLESLKNLKKTPHYQIGLLQALGLVGYVGLISLLIFNGNAVFGKMNNLLGPVLFLLIFIVSAIISALIVLGYPFLLFWEDKKTKEALRIIAYTTLWLILFILIILTGFLLSKSYR